MIDEVRNINYRGLDRPIEAVVMVLMATGTVFVVSAGANLSSSFDLRHFYDFTTLKQIMFFPIAVLVMYAFSFVDYRRFSFGDEGRSGFFGSFTGYLLIIAMVLLVLVLIPGIGIEKNYSRRWLAIGVGVASISFQPSELAKWSVLIFLAAYMAKFSDSMSSFAKRFIPLCCVVGAVVGLIITQDFGTAVFIAAITTVMFLIGAVKWWHLLTPLPLLIPAFYFAVRTSPTRMNRIRAFLNPDSLDIAANYQASQSLIAISGGGIFGRGFGRGISKYGHLPEDTTDFIFAIIAEELGFVGAIFVIALFVAFVVLGIIVAMRCRDKFAALLAAGIVLTIGIQAAINIGVVTAVLPTKGIPLPFISAGGTSMLLSAAAVGILLNIAKQTSRASDSAGGIGR